MKQSCLLIIFVFKTLLTKSKFFNAKSPLTLIANTYIGVNNNKSNGKREWRPHHDRHTPQANNSTRVRNDKLCQTPWPTTRSVMRSSGCDQFGTNTVNTAAIMEINGKFFLFLCVWFDVDEWRHKTKNKKQKNKNKNKQKQTKNNKMNNSIQTVNKKNCNVKRASQFARSSTDQRRREVDRAHANARSKSAEKFLLFQWIVNPCTFVFINLNLFKQFLF